MGPYGTTTSYLQTTNGSFQHFFATKTIGISLQPGPEQRRWLRGSWGMVLWKFLWNYHLPRDFPRICMDLLGLARQITIGKSWILYGFVSFTEGNVGNHVLNRCVLDAERRGGGDSEARWQPLPLLKVFVEGDGSFYQTHKKLNFQDSGNLGTSS